MIRETLLGRLGCLVLLALLGCSRHPGGGAAPVLSPTISAFTATPSSITAGQSSTLSWVVSGAISLSINANVGTVTGTNTVVSPTVSTTYTLTATNASGSATATLILAVTTSTVAGSAASGSVPALLPARLSVGLMEDPGATWMKTSGVPWDMRYHYFTVGWRNNWGWTRSIWSA